MTNKLQFGQILIIIGFVVSVVYFTLNFHDTGIAGILSLGMIGIYAAGIYFVAKAKGYPGIYAGLALLFVIGAFLILILPDKKGLEKLTS